MSNSAIDNEWDGDVLNRKKYSVFLTKYLEDKSEACVININAPWGSGKTFFLKKWFEDIKKSHPAVYFNAWKNDYSDDPLISIISCIRKDLTDLLPEDAKNAHTVKNFLSKSGLMIKKLAPEMIKGVLSKAIGDGGVEALTEITSDNEALIADLSSKFAEELLSSNEAVSSSINDFKKSISSLINEVAENNEYFKIPLFVFIDELDRCRPLYSIELLERIKHIFDIPDVVFVVATDTQQLSHSVKAVYGEGFNGEIYLRRFFNQIYTLPEPNCIEFTTVLFKDFKPKAKYFNYQISADGKSLREHIEANNNTLTCEPSEHAEKILLFSLFAKLFKLDLRTKKQCFDRFVAIERSLLKKEELHFGYLIFLIMLDAKYPAQFQKYFAFSSDEQRNRLLNGLEPSLENVTGSNQYTATGLISQYSHRIFLTKHNIRKLSENENDEFIIGFSWSLHDNYEYLVKYKERVEMAGALG